MEKKKVRHSEKIHEFFEGSPVCTVIHRLNLCGCGSHEEKKGEEQKEGRIAQLTEYRKELSRELQRVEEHIASLKNE
jgi:hypothetical protein